jgi:hypothetical protein
MFGASAFGQPYFGQIAASRAAALLTAATLAVGTDAALTTTPALAAVPIIAVGSDATLTVQGPLLAGPVVSFGSTAALAVRSILQATATIAFATDGTVVVPGDLHAAAAVTFAAAPPRLAIGAVRLLAESTVAVGSTAAALGTLPADFHAAATARFGAVGSLTQSGVGASDVVIAFDGAIVTPRVRQGSIDIQDVLNEAPNTASFLVDHDPPGVGVDVKIGLQNLLVSNLLFAGTVKRRQQLYEARTQTLYWSVDCEDYTYLLNRRRVFGTWTNVSASTVARAILASFTSGFSNAGIVDALPLVTVTFIGETVMDALATIAGLVGGYTKVDYGKVVWLFITDPGAPPTAVTPTNRLLQFLPPVTPTIDVSQTRTRVHVRGAAVSVVGPPDTTINASPVPLDQSAMFAPSGKAITDDGQILAYTGTSPGGVAAVVVGNVAGPASGGTPALAPNVAGRLSGTYRWAVAFANAQGETPVGPPSASLFCPDVTSPTAAPGLGYANNVGPLVGTYDYRIAYITSLGETLPGPSSRRVANALVPPAFPMSSSNGLCRLAPGQYRYVVTYRTPYGETVASPASVINQTDIVPPFGLSVSNLNPPGPLKAASYSYRSTLITQDGESAPGPVVAFTPSALSLPAVGSFQASGFGGIRGGPYYYGISLVTLIGESMLNVQYAGTGFGQNYPNSGPQWSGSWDPNGRIEPGYTYIYASSFYSDRWGETGLSATSNSVTLGGTNSYRLIIYTGSFPPSGADGVRIYRAIANGGQFALVADFRQGNVPGSFWDNLSQGEAGGIYPIQPLKAGNGCSVTLFSSSEAGVIARRLYRTKANGGEYFLVAEVQSNNQATVIDQLEDAQLVQRSMVSATTGRQAAVAVPTGPAGTLARRVYRSKRDTASPFFFVGELRDNVTTTLTDNIDDTGLASTIPALNTAGSSTLPVVILPTGPPGVLARRIYRTQANGTQFALLAEIPDNVTGSYTDNTPDAAITGDAPPTASYVGEQVIVTSLPIGPVGTLARVIYRTKAGGGEFHEVDRISDNVTTSYLDYVADANLGGGVSLVNNAGSSAVNLSNVPLGPAGVTQRIIYRTVAGGTDFRYVGAISDNVSTTFLDTRGDTDLGRAPQLTSTIGALIADTFLALNTVVGFPAPGWINVDNQFIRYAAIAGNTLTGIPSSGAGAVLAPIRGGAAVLTVAQLTGVTGIANPLPVGSSVSLWVTSDSLPGQAALAAVEGGDGIHEFVVTDTTLDTIAACGARGRAELELFQFANVSLAYATRDRLTRSGATVPVHLPAPWNVDRDFIIQSVRITEVDIAPKTFPKYLVECSDTKFSLQDLLRHVVLDI